MCERTCPRCGSAEHLAAYGLIGNCIVCTGCCAYLAVRRDEEAAPLDHPDPSAWAAEGTFVLDGAEAADPADDEIFRRTSA